MFALANLPYIFGEKIPFSGKWRIEAIEFTNESADSWKSSGNSNFILEFKDDETIGADGSCNSLGGSFKLISISQISIVFGGTKKLCNPKEPNFWLLNNTYEYNFDDSQTLLYFKFKNEYAGEGKFRLSRWKNT